MGICKVGIIEQRLLIRNSGNQEKSRERITMKNMKVEQLGISYPECCQVSM
jgi:hypothetical protein